jgi:hypothetical protein
MATAYSTRPSAILGLRPDSWAAYDLDRALLALAGRVEEAADRARARAPRRASPAAVARRVEAAVREVLTTPAERRERAEALERLRRRRVEFVWAEGERRGPASLLAVRAVEEG